MHNRDFQDKEAIPVRPYSVVTEGVRWVRLHSSLEKNCPVQRNMKIISRYEWHPSLACIFQNLVVDTPLVIS